MNTKEKIQTVPKDKFICSNGIFQEYNTSDYRKHPNVPN